MTTREASPVADAGLAPRVLTRGTLARLLRAWLVTAVVDGLFASALTVFAYRSTVTRLWQGVAATLLGRDAFNGGTRTALIGVAMHVGVAFAWSAVFVFLYTQAARIRRLVQSRFGVLKVATLYGPFVWLVMSLLVIPSLTHRAPTITYRWWVQLVGHIFFVAVPIVAATAWREERSG